MRTSRHPSTRNSKKIIIGIIAGFFTLFIAVLFIVPPVAVHVITSGHVDYGVIEGHRLQHIYTAADFDLQSNDLMLTTQDGFEVWISEVPVEKPEAVVIYLTGIRQPSVTYFYGHAALMKDCSVASLLLEVRGHGRSSGDRVSLGYEEVNDVRAAVDYIKRQEQYQNVPIVIHGVSMGGAIAVNAFGQIEELSGLIAMSAYSSFEDVVADTMRAYHVPGFLCEIEKPLFRWALRQQFGDAVSELAPIVQVQNIGDRPALLIASAHDWEVPAENMERLLHAAPDHCEGWLRESELTGHFIVLNHNIEDVALDAEYCQRVQDFLQDVIQYHKGL